MSDRRVLFIVEGKQNEPRMLTSMHRVLMGTRPENIFVHGASIHQLLRKMFPDGSIDEDLDVVSVLREDASEDERRVLDQEFSDVFLVFDMDPQDSVYDDERLRIAIGFFDDSTGNGKLYLNYPMMQSYRHLRYPFDRDYLHRTVTMDDIRSGYKSLVDKESYPGIKNVGQYDRTVFLMIIYLNLRKVNRIMNSEDTVPDPESYLGWDLSVLLDRQLDLLRTEDSISVVNTSVFNAVDFLTESILTELAGDGWDVRDCSVGDDRCRYRSVLSDANGPGRSCDPVQSATTRVTDHRDAGPSPCYVVQMF